MKNSVILVLRVDSILSFFAVCMHVCFAYICMYAQIRARRKFCSIWKQQEFPLSITVSHNTCQMPPSPPSAICKAKLGVSRVY